MERPDRYSFQCGVLAGFGEMVGMGVKALALSHPLDSAEERDALIPFVREDCRRYGNRFYAEDELLTCDLFPASQSEGRFFLLLYREPHVLEQYLRLKERKRSLLAERAYFGGNRTQIALEFGRLLSYGDDVIRRLIAENREG